jgi:hypothetical protein
LQAVALDGLVVEGPSSDLMALLNVNFSSFLSDVVPEKFENLADACGARLLRENKGWVDIQLAFA